MNNTDNLSVKAPWIKNLGGVPAHLEYFQGSMYDKIAQIAVNYPDYIAYDFMGDKERALKSKFEIAKFMGELAKHGGDLGETLNDQGFVKKTSLDLKALKSSISNDDNGGSSTYILKK